MDLTPNPQRPKVLTTAARIEHATAGRRVLDVVEQLLHTLNGLTEMDLLKVQALAQVAQAHFTAAGLANHHSSDDEDFGIPSRRAW